MPSRHSTWPDLRAIMHHLRPPARMPTYISSIEDESESRASPAVLLRFYFLRTEVHTDDDKPPACGKLVHRFLHRQLLFFGERSSARSSLNKSSSCYIFSRKRPSLIPSCLIVPRIFCLQGITTVLSLDIRRYFVLH